MSSPTNEGLLEANSSAKEIEAEIEARTKDSELFFNYPTRPFDWGLMLAQGICCFTKNSEFIKTIDSIPTKYLGFNKEFWTADMRHVVRVPLKAKNSTDEEVSNKNIYTFIKPSCDRFSKSIAVILIPTEGPIKVIESEEAETKNNNPSSAKAKSKDKLTNRTDKPGTQKSA